MLSSNGSHSVRSDQIGVTLSLLVWSPCLPSERSQVYERTLNSLSVSHHDLENGSIYFDAVFAFTFPGGNYVR